MAASAVQGARRSAANVRCVHPFSRLGSLQNGGASCPVDRTQITSVDTAMRTPTAMTCNAHRWSQRGRLLGHTSKSPKAAVADRPMMLVRRKSEDGELLQTPVIRRPTPVDMISATATRRDVFAMKPAG